MTAARGPANPLLDEFRTATVGGAVAESVDAARARLVAVYGFAVPTDEALEAVARASPAGVVEVGAGTGYWAHQLRERGVDVVAVDIEPAPSARSEWFAGARPWHPVHRGDHGVAGAHPDRTLLLVWPTKDAIWAASAVERYHEAGGRCVVYVGEPPGGRTGDAVFHALLGELTTCLQCAYGSTTSPCTCGVEARWQRAATIALPHWPGCRDDLQVYVRRSPERRRRRWRASGSRARAV